MTKKLFLATSIIVAALCGCSSKPSSTASSSKKAANDSTLVLYYSQTGATKAVAEELQKQLGCAIAAIEAANPYDGDYDATIKRWSTELKNNVKVAIKPLEVNLNNYKTIFLGFPIWGGTYALPVATFLADNSLADKNIITFATFGSGGTGSATANVAKAQPAAKVTQGYGVRNARVSKSPAEIKRFLIERNYISGDIKPLPDYSASAPVSDKDAAVFKAACGDYKYPLGTPVSVAKRTMEYGTDYKFDVKSQTPDGQKATSTIYVTVAQGEKPEFTEVVRH